MPPQPSIRRSLRQWLLPSLLGLLLLSAVSAYYRAVDISNTVYDRALYDGVLTLGILVHVEHGRVRVDMPPVAQRMLEVDPLDTIYFTVQDEQGHTLQGDVYLPVIAPRRALRTTPIFYDAKIDEQRVRVACARVYATGQAPPVLVAVAETLKKRRQMQQSILRESIAPQVLFLLLAMSLLWWSVRRALQPLDSLSAIVDRRSALDFTALDLLRMPVEIQPLGRAFNGLMQRYAASFSLHQRFTANAAHQLRTPVAGMRAMIEAQMIGQPEASWSPLLRRLHQATLRLSRLVQQLLLLARAEPGNARQLQRIDLAQLFGDVIADMQRTGAGARLRWRHEPVHVQGDAAMLGEMLRNLLDNALRYSDPATPVDVELRAAPEGAILCVEDHGPGIPEAETQRVFERFYRGGQVSGEGTGLGLAIVKEIADAHAIEIHLSTLDGTTGTRFILRWPQSSVLSAAEASATR